MAHPYPASTQILRGGDWASCLSLPVVPLQGGAQPVSFRPSPIKVLPPGAAQPAPVWQVEQDQLSGRTSVRIGWRSESRIDEHTRAIHELSGRFSVEAEDPARAVAEGQYIAVFSQNEREVQAESQVRLESNLDFFFLSIDLVVRRDGFLYFHKSWNETYPRLLL